MPHPTVWLNEGVADELAAEATRSAPDETGGMLLGWHNLERNEIVVAAAVGPGPNAAHLALSFRPDSSWQQEQLDADYERSDGRVTYLGDWHVHPRGGFKLSRQDTRTLSRVASHTEARCDQPIMGLLAPVRDGYQVGIWRWERSWNPLGHGKVRSLPVRLWRPSPEEAFWLPR